MEDFNLKISGTELFHKETKEKIRKGLSNGDNIDKVINDSLPNNIPNETKEMIKKDLEKYL